MSDPRDTRIAALERALREADDSLRYGEGIGLLYYMDAKSADGLLIAEVLAKPLTDSADRR